MPVFAQGREVLRYAGAATAVAPYLRELATDPGLHEGFRGTLHVLARISDEMAADERLRDRLFDRAGQAEAEAAAREARQRRQARWALAGLGVAVAIGVVAGMLLYPPSRLRVTQAVGQARQRVAGAGGRLRRAQPEPVTADQDGTRAAA